MTRKQRRMSFVLAGLVLLGVASALVLTALSDSIVYFYSPTDLVEKKPPLDQRLRIGGLVEAGSIKRSDDRVDVSFTVTDTANKIQVAYRGVLPDLFREGQGVVAEGRIQPNGVFKADEVLAKHDEKYMPPEVAESLRKAGMWKGKQEK